MLLIPILYFIWPQKYAETKLNVFKNENYFNIPLIWWPDLRAVHVCCGLVLGCYLKQGTLPKRRVRIKSEKSGASIAFKVDFVCCFKLGSRCVGNVPGFIYFYDYVLCHLKVFYSSGCNCVFLMKCCLIKFKNALSQRMYHSVSTKILIGKSNSGMSQQLFCRYELESGCLKLNSALFCWLAIWMSYKLLNLHALNF